MAAVPHSVPHAVVHRLNTMLSARGAQALPYQEDQKALVRTHVLNLLERYPTLQAEGSQFMHNDGAPHAQRYERTATAAAVAARLPRQAAATAVVCTAASAV